MRAAFYAPLKSVDHPVPSGERQIARLTLEALRQAGFAPEVVSAFRSLEKHGEKAAQDRLIAEAEAEAEAVIARLRPDPPALWFTYHSYYKAPDLIGPTVARALAIPYAISEPSYAPRRLSGPWSAFARANVEALQAADHLLWTTERDRPALAALAPDRLVHLPAFVAPGPAPAVRSDPATPLALLTVAMMRPGDKLASYTALAAALAPLDDLAWTLTIVGDGRARAEVEALFGPFGDQVIWRDAAAPEMLREIYAGHDILVWPGVGEGIGMVYLEAQAAGLPVLAEDRPGPRDVIATRPLPAPGDARAFAAAIRRLADPGAWREAAAAARQHVAAHHSIEAAAAILSQTLGRAP
ncbi:MAG: glycosyltransferase family 4 protein [Pseudomonadota bacterium]